MKQLLFLLSMLFFFFVSTETVQAQLSFELKSKGYKRDNYVTIKGYEIDSKEQYPYMFSNLSSYLIEIKNTQKPNNEVAIRIYDEQNTEIASNYNPKTQTFLHKLSFQCSKTGFYYLSFEPLKK